MYPDYLIKIGGKGYVTLYGVCIAIGILCCFLTLNLYVKKKKIDEKMGDFTFYVAIIAIALGFLSATLFQSVYNYIENPSKGFEFGGMTFIGGLIGGVTVFLVIYFATKNNIRKNYKSSLIDIMPVVPCCITVAHGFGRVGCFFAGCCYGKETDGPFGIKFPDLPNPVYPTQLFEAIFLFVFFAVLVYLAFKVNVKGNFNMGVYCLGYGIFRFAIEFLRGDDRGKLFNLLSPSQFWSVLMILIGLFIVFALPVIQSRLAAKKAETAPVAADGESVAAPAAPSDDNEPAKEKTEDKPE